MVVYVGLGTIGSQARVTGATDTAPVIVAKIMSSMNTKRSCLKGEKQMNNEPRWHEMTYADIGVMFKELENARNGWRTLAETMHEVLRDNGIMFRCNCQDPKCQEMKVYLDTVK